VHAVHSRIRLEVRSEAEVGTMGDDELAHLKKIREYLRVLVFLAVLGFLLQLGAFLVGLVGGQMGGM
jgi:hypothetical protein